MPDTALNNGQVGRVDAFIGRDAGGNPVKAWEQRFAYDATGRLSRAREVRSDTGASVWQQHFTYDRYGNRYQAPAGTPGNYNEGLGWFKVETGDINPQTNRYTLPSITYNSAGQMTQNTYHRNSKYVYDANGRVRAWMRPDNTDRRTNVTDGVGARVMVYNDTSWRHIVWDVFGRIVAEYTSGVGLESENLYRAEGSAPLARRSTAGGQTSVKWEMTDLQGSVRLLTDANGAATNRYDYTPFGETLGAGTGTRASTQGYTGGQLRHRYAGMTSDYTATTLEDTPWRKMDSKAGRWTTPDPYLGSMTVSDPQSFNRYAYVGNDPVNFVDPSGLNGIQLENENVDVIASAYDPFDDPFFSGYGWGGAVVMPELPIIEVLTPIVVDPSAPTTDPAQDNRTDCERFADMVDQFARQNSTIPGFVRALYNEFSNPNDARFRAGGFRDGFVDPGGSPNQVRHAVGAISAGYAAGVATLALASPLRGNSAALATALDAFNGRERSYSNTIVPGTPAGVTVYQRVLLPPTASQAADMRLNGVAVPLGFALGSNQIRTNQVGDAIRNQICNPR